MRSFEAVMHYRVEVADALERLETNAMFYPIDTRAGALLGRKVYRLDIKRSYRLYFVVDKDAATVTVFSFLRRLQNVS